MKTTFDPVMQKEKLAAIVLVIVIVGALAAFIAVTYGGDILKNLSGEKAQVLAKNDNIICYENYTNNITEILENDKFTNLSSVEVLTQPSHGVINQTIQTISYIPNKDFLGTDSFTYKIIDKNGQTSSATVKITVQVPLIEIGDCADVFYIGKFVNGTVFDTNYEDVAKQWGIYNASLAYEAAEVFVDPSYELEPPVGYENYTQYNYVVGFLNGLVGMGEGENKTITVPPEDAYGTWNVTMADEWFGLGSYPLETVIPNDYTENITEFSQYFPDVNIVVGGTFDYGAIAFEKTGIMNATITEVTDENVSYRLLPVNNSTVKIPLFNWNVTFIVTNDTAFTMRSHIEVNHTFSIQYYGNINFKVVAVNETSATLGVNLDAPSPEFVDQTLIFELHVVKIYKTSTQLES